MNLSNHQLNEKELSALLKKTGMQPSNERFSQKVMAQVYQYEARKNSWQKYIRRSWVLFFFSVCLAILIFGFQNSLQQTFQSLADSLIPGLYDVFNYLLIIAVSGLMFYELNLLSHRFFQDKGVKVQG